MPLPTWQDIPISLMWRERLEQNHRFGEKKFNHRANSENLISARYYSGGLPVLPLRLSHLAGVKRPANFSCVSANDTTHNLLGAGVKQPSVNSVQLLSYQLTRKSVSSSVKKSPFRVTLQGKWRFGCLYLRSRIRVHNKFTDSAGRKNSSFACFTGSTLYWNKPKKQVENQRED